MGVDPFEELFGQEGGDHIADVLKRIEADESVPTSGVREEILEIFDDAASRRAPTSKMPDLDYYDNL